MNRGTAVLVASCLALTAANGLPAPAPAQITLTPRVLQIDQIKCAELLAGSDQKQERLLIYFNGYVDGLRRHTVWDERQVGEAVDRVIASCKANPAESLLSTFTRALR